MFIYNLNLNAKNTAKIVFIILTALTLVLLGFAVYKMFAKNVRVHDIVDHPDIAYIDSDNYTNILREVYDNLETYLGQKICFTGYVYRLSDFKNNQFVLARNMLTNNSYKTLVVGFLCEYEKANQFGDNSWVEVTGEIIKGTYHSDIPVIKIIKIESVDKPENEYVPFPDNTYIPASVIY